MYVVVVVYQGLDDMPGRSETPGRSGIRGGTAGCVYAPKGRLQQISITK